MRSIRQEHRVSDKLDQATYQSGRLDEVYRSIEWLLSRQPERGVRVPNTNPVRYLIKVDPVASAGSKGLLLLYTFDDSYVDILDIKIIEPF